jgi:dienelactone hydrolase
MSPQRISLTRTAILCVALALASCGAAPAFASDPPAELLRVRPAPPEGPRITPYLTSQLERAWALDDVRRQRFEKLRTHNDVVKLQSELRQRALDAIGGLPDQRTPLNARIVDTVRMDGYRIEKVIFESVPGLHVTALVYVPDAPAGPKPAVLVGCGHSPLGKAFVNYQNIAGRLAKRGYVVICWDPVGQGERSQFWDAARHRSRYNLVCGEHAILGNLATIAGTSLTRWMVWDGMRAVDYLLTRDDVDPKRLAITGTSGGGFQSLWIGALDARIAVVAPSAFVTALPARMANRIFDDPDSDPEQDPFGLVSSGVDHAGLLLLSYPRAIHVSAAVQDFFPIEGTRKTMRELTAVYERLGIGDRIKLKEGYHRHAYSDENQISAFAFIDRMLKMPVRHVLDPVKTLEPAALNVTKSGQVRVDLADSGRSLVDVIRDDWKRQRSRTQSANGSFSLAAMYGKYGTYGKYGNSTVASLPIVPDDDAKPPRQAIAWTRVGSSEWEGVTVDRYVLRHSDRLEIPVLHVRRTGEATSGRSGRVLLSLGLHGHIEPSDWSAVVKHLDAGFEVVSFDLRGTGESRIAYKVNSELPEPKPTDEREIYAFPTGSVLANHVYNAQLIGRPYLLDALEDVEIVTRFVRRQLGASSVSVSGRGEADLLSRAAAQVFNLTHVAAADAVTIDWAEIVEQGRELWPIQYLVSGGANFTLTRAPASDR